jgi:beta-lactam-binding protein with PASTA domain/tRNA A-37 threonylcarbamoyl transferase component Bud32
MSDQGPTVFNGRYELLRHIARGGMADVYLARDDLLDREVALKVLFPEFANDPNFVERFRREAQAAANLNHPNIVGIYDWGQERGTYYIVMEHVSGRSMSDVLRSTGPLQADRAAEIASDVAAALATAHQAGLVHRDVKLGNILVSDAGDVKVADFGIATALAGGTDAGLTQHGSVMGTATYFSPEQAQGKQVDGRSDLYSLGVVLYEMLAGVPPFQAETPVAVAYKHVQERPDTLLERGVTVAKSLDAITMKLLAKNPANRYPTADDLRSDLGRYLAGAHQVPGAAGAAAAGAAVVATPEPASAAPPAVDPTTVQPVTPAAATPATVPAQPGLTMDPTGLAAQYASGDYYYDDGLPESNDWKRTVGLVVGLGLLIFVLGFLTIAFVNELGLFDGNGNGEETAAVEKVDVPNLRTMQVADAEAALRELQLVPVITERQNSSIPVGEVFDQAPPAGQRLDPGEEVELIVSTGEAITVPTLIGMTQQEAIDALSARGYTTTVEPTPDIQEFGKVIGQSPVPGTAHPLDEPVEIRVSIGPEQVAIPDLEGMGLSAAITSLQERGLTIDGEAVREFSEDIEADKVTRTEPEANTLVTKGSLVTLYQSDGVPQISIPTLVGLFADNAVVTLRSQGLEPVVERQTVPFGDPLVGLVISQTPGEFTEVDLGSEVVIVVGEAGPEPTTTTTTTTTTTSAPPPDDG